MDAVPKTPCQTNYFLYCKRVSANAKHSCVSYIYVFYAVLQHNQLLFRTGQILASRFG